MQIPTRRYDAACSEGAKAAEMLRQAQAALSQEGLTPELAFQHDLVEAKEMANSLKRRLASAEGEALRSRKVRVRGWHGRC